MVLKATCLLFHVPRWTSKIPPDKGIFSLLPCPQSSSLVDLGGSKTLLEISPRAAMNLRVSFIRSSGAAWSWVLGFSGISVGANKGYHLSRGGGP